MTIEVLDPSTEQRIGEVPHASIQDCLDAVDAAAAAAAPWRALPPRERGEVLRRAHELILGEAEGLARLISSENGKSLADARGEVAYAAEFFRWFSEEAVRIEGSLGLSPNGDKRIMVSRQPIGVALLITPWNFPAAMATRKIAPALAAGCTIVLKPASETPLTAFRVAELLGAAGVPAGAVNVVCPRPPGPAVEAMAAHPAVRTISFTGSTEVGAGLIALSAPRVLRCSMELGGNAPLIVYDDADLDVAVEGAFVAKMRNGGASCIAANRVFLQRGIADRFTEELTRRMAAVSVGPPLDEGAELGPLVSAREQRRVANLVEAAVGDGAEASTGGSPPERPGFFYPPTVLTQVDFEAPILAEEIFGPVAPLVVFDTEEEVLERANATEFGLAGYVFSSNLERALRTAEALEIGIIGINRGYVSDPAAPFGGYKGSGLGREGGREGIEEFLETKYIAVDW
ncbi:MAG: NAD-dependent succinate-semialdehyde dehydrogenase [Solirubrobacterales bacterium]